MKLQKIYTEEVPLGELFTRDWKTRKEGDAQFNHQQTTSSAASKVQSSDAADICENRHKGNEESRTAFRSIKDRLSGRRLEVFCLIKSFREGVTVDELSRILETTPNAISGRVTELKIMGKIRKDGTKLTRSGNPAAILKSV